MMNGFLRGGIQAGLFTVLLVASQTVLTAAPATAPRATPDLVFEEVDGMVAVEAEHFFKQEKTGKRAWHLTSSKSAPAIEPDGDPAHVGGASGGAYLEILPDNRRNHGEKLIHGENFSNEPGKLALLYYKVHFNNPGRYYVWVRAYSTGSEDNGLHVGLNGEWPATGQRLQWCQGKRSWRWESKQRTQKNHCGEPHKIFLDVKEPGEHVVMFSMREDGFEFDKWLMTMRRDLERPSDAGPKTRIRQGKAPAAFPLVAATQAVEPTPRPAPQARALPDSRIGPKDSLLMAAYDFEVTSGYYQDQGKWLAINPAAHKKAAASLAFPYPPGQYDITLHAVGENDGQSSYQVRQGTKVLGDFKAPLSQQTYEEGKAFTRTWAKMAVNQGDVFHVASAIASEDGQEFSRARWSGLTFRPADVATLAAVTAFTADLRKKAASERPEWPPLQTPRQPDGDGHVAVTGDLMQWHKVTLTLNGPYAHELDNKPNPFTDYRMTAVFTHASGQPTYRIPGYFAADGQAANSSAQSGTQWRAHLSPDKTGRWNYEILLDRADDIAMMAASESHPVAAFSGRKGSFEIRPSNKKGRDFRARGRLQYVGGHHLRFAGSGEYFFKAGPDAPETFLAYQDFDNTQARSAKGPLKTWKPHLKDWRFGDPTWKNGKGKGMIGALNYLAVKGVNSFSFLPYNAGGDGDNIWPFVRRDDKFHYDCSKLDQWQVVFDHATALGLHLHFKMQENEMDDDRRGHKAQPGRVPESLDGGKLGRERKLYCRELIARFGHELALNWNLGEENTQSPQEQKDMAAWIRDLDPYGHNIVIHTFPDQQDKVYPPLLGKDTAFTGASLQNGWNVVHERTLKWIRASARAGKPWVVANDEQGPASMGVPPDPGFQGHNGKAKQGKTTYDLHDIRKYTLWANLMAGGAGVEYYFGYQLPENDLVAEDFRSRDKTWDYCRLAIQFLKDHKVPFWKMGNANQLLDEQKGNQGPYCLAQPNSLYLVYLPKGGTAKLNLTQATGSFQLSWFNPRQGGALKKGTVTSVKGGQTVGIGFPPPDPNQDWLAVIRR